MARIRFSVATVLALTGCADLVPPSAAPDPSLAEKVQTLMGNEVCSNRVAGALAAYHVTAGEIGGIELAPWIPGWPTEYTLAQRQAWVRQAGKPGAIVVRYDPRDCRIATVYARDGATLPSA